MSKEQLLELISIDPRSAMVDLAFAGPECWSRVILDSLAAGMSGADIIVEYPFLTPHGVHAAAGYGAWLDRQEIQPLAPSGR